MTTESGAPAGQSAAPAIDSDELSLEDARSIIDSGNFVQHIETEDGQEIEQGAKPATAKQESPSKEEDADPETDPSEKEPKADDQEDEELPPIERPRSWAKELDEEWASYPRAAQERIAKREQERDTAIRRSQNEAAEERKAAKAAQDSAEKARQQYETQLPALMQALNDANAAQFSDIKSIEDVTKLAAEDPFRYLQWQAHQQKMAAVKAEQDAADKRTNDEKITKRQTIEQEQNRLLADLVPELADPKKGNELLNHAMADLGKRGITQEQLSRWAATDIGHEILANANVQKLMIDGFRYNEIQNAPKAIAARSVPQVQKPGVQRSANTDDASIQALTRRLNDSGSEADGWALLEAQMKSNSRRRAS